MDNTNARKINISQLLIALGALLISIIWAVGAAKIPSESGYAGVGADFVPWLVSIVVGACSLWLLWEVVTGGFRNFDESANEAPASWMAFAYLSAAVLLNAMLIERIGFILSCAMGFVLAVRGIRIGQAQAAGSAKQWVMDAAVGVCITAPVFWLFTKGLNVNLPGLTQSGWI